MKRLVPLFLFFTAFMATAQNTGEITGFQSLEVLVDQHYPLADNVTGKVLWV